MSDNAQTTHSPNDTPQNLVSGDNPQKEHIAKSLDDLTQAVQEIDALVGQLGADANHTAPQVQPSESVPAPLQPASTEPKPEPKPKPETEPKDNKKSENVAQTAQVVSGKSLKFAVAQMPFMVGDIASNLKRMKLAIHDAKEKGVNVLIFSEMALLGYPCGGLLKHPNLGERVKSAIASLAEESHDMVILVGYPHIDLHGTFNSVAILQGGVQKGFYHKQLLQDDGIFDESRYFNTGLNQVIFDYKGVSIGLLIGRDLAKKQPIKALKEAGAEVIVCVNASAFAQDRQEQRKQLLATRAKSCELPIIYANAVGGQERAVFDGGSMVVNKDGKVLHEATRFLGQFLIANYDVATHTFDEQQKSALILSQEAELYQSLVVGLRDYVNRSGFKGVIIGLSGGLDSALTLCIAVDALGADKVYAVMMPYKYTSAMSVEDAEAQAKRLNVGYTICPIFDAMAGFRATLLPLFAESTGVDTTEENLQARIRGTILMALSNKFGHMVVNTSNKSESAVGYGTLYGDLVGGFGALADVYKTDVYRLANYRNRLEDDPVIPERVISRPPSAELRPNQTDQDNLPDYEILDGILRLYVEGNKSFESIVKAGFDEAVVAKVLKMVDKNEYKRRQAPFGAKVSAKSFGERDYPIVQGWQHKV